MHRIPIRIRQGAATKLTRWTAGVGFGAAATTVMLIASLAVPPRAYAAVATVGLGTADTYSVLGGQTVTNIGPTSLSGDLGVSPGTAITGFPPGTVGGATHAGDAAAGQAQLDLTIGYNDAAGRAPTASVAGDLVGRTLTSGVYKSTGPLALSGTLTLDAQGNPDAVFIFQIASTLITASASRVTAINGAQACHVFWQVGSSGTLGTNSSFIGTIMALTSITVTTGTNVKGRALARNGAVTLDDNTFTSPACDTTPPSIPTTTTLAASPNPATTGDAVALTAAVAAQGPVTTGTVSFTERGGSLGTATLNATGHAKITIPAGMSPRTRTITAHYNGHLKFTPSTSRATRLAVRARTSSSAATPTNTTTTSPGLAATGARQLTALTGIGSALIAIGIALVLTAARRYRPKHRH
jgi:Ice-binding-like/Bacterial Ig-like domain (group 3)